MQTDQWQRVEEIYYAALELATSQRHAYLVAACAGNEALLREVESLLNAHEDAGTFLQAPAVIVSAEERLHSEAAAPAPASLLGSRISHYQILAALGAGGKAKFIWPKTRGCAARSR